MLPLQLWVAVQRGVDRRVVVHELERLPHGEVREVLVQLRDVLHELAQVHAGTGTVRGTRVGDGALRVAGRQLLGESLQEGGPAVGEAQWQGQGQAGGGTGSQECRWGVTPSTRATTVQPFASPRQRPRVPNDATGLGTPIAARQGRPGAAPPQRTNAGAGSG